ncbi:MAG: 4-hydroxythreonine-4-phosphate dehydrogenase PdxA [Paludibacter sp.]|jgi:4-hydroxythreonine-4-phosphate dehydrogenase|nr:4-hydroxythreonine-4-phosphate dehydrogenase PdxA [Paludibacter sp.]
MLANKPVIAVTHGDMNSISYEVILKTFAEPRVFEEFIPVIYGSSKAAAYHRKQLDIQGVNLNVINAIEEALPKKINLINCTEDELKVDLGRSTEEAGKAALAALQKVVVDMKSGIIDAIVTGPINKKNIQSDEFHFPGHTEFLEEHLGDGQKALMLLVNDVMRVAVVTGHIPVKEISKTLTAELIIEKLRIFNRSLKQDFTIVRPRIAVLGLNPHAGDEGVIGNEENMIKEAMQAVEKDGLLTFGPYPADGFFGSGNFNRFDGILAMYHDQGLIPFKTISMDQGVNFTAGLPVIRTSPAHGTAYDIAGKNMASEESFRQALFMAYDIINNRAIHREMSANPLKVEEKRASRIA